MKKVFSLLLVVAMLLSMSTFAFAAQGDMRMKATVTETDEAITVVISAWGATGISSITSYLKHDNLTVKDYTVGDVFAGASVTAPTASRPTKWVISHTDKGLYFDAATETVLLTYTVEKVAGVEEISAADFEWQNGTLTLSKLVADQTITSKAQPTQFSVEYIDARTPIVEEPDFGASAAGTTITCFGKVDSTVSNYGVEFTAESTVEGARAQKYYGAMNGDTVKDYNGATTFNFGDWDGSFEIILEGVHAGTKVVNFFVNDTIIADTTFTVVVE